MEYDEESIKLSLEKGAIVKLIGDSITAGGGSSDNNRIGEVIININGNEYRRQVGEKCWASLLKRHIEQKYPQSQVINNGCSDITSTHVKDHLLQLFNDYDDIVIIMIGANDRKQVDGMKNLYNNLIFIINRIKQTKKIIVLMSPNPSTAANQARPDRLYTLEDVNDVIRRVSEEKKIQFISNYDYINSYLAMSGRTIENLMIGKSEKLDGLHPSDEAHYLIFRNIVQSLFID